MRFTDTEVRDTEDEYPLKGRENLSLALQSLHLRRFLLLCVMTRKVGLLVTTRQLFALSSRSLTLMCVCVYMFECPRASECGYAPSTNQVTGENNFWEEEVSMQDTKMS